ncbi:MAG: hypothetical protein IT423_21015 [Pirellulaceae bacterium]|nr:hypothetical protein [Pirellulaceae bacterium]
MLIRSISLALVLCLTCGSLPVVNLSLGRLANAQDAKKAAAAVELAGGKIRLTAPAEWKAVPPKNNIIQYEYNAPADAKADKQARITVSTAMGSIAQNIDRWYAQFDQPDGSATKDKSKVEKFDAAGQTVHLVEIPGTFKDSGGAGPFQQAPSVKRENYRMLGAIVETKEMGTHFFKVTGPADSVDKLKAGFRKMLETMEVKK